VAVEILDRTPSYDPWLRSAIAVGATLAAATLLAATYLRQWRLMTVAAGLAIASLLAAPAVYAVSTATSAASGSMPSAGPSAVGGRGGPGGVGGGAGGSTSADAGLVSYLEAHRGNAEYLVAAFGSQASAPIIIASGQPVITIGGFNGGDPAPTLAQFEQLVAQGKVRYVLISNGGGFGGGGFGGGGSGGGGFGVGGPGGGSTSSISSWVTAHGTEVPASSYGDGATSGTLYQLS
jgi:4-amino-4-deoxy-L-arabinose transferase-like glycosyltransferase